MAFLHLTRILIPVHVRAKSTAPSLLYLHIADPCSGYSASDIKLSDACLRQIWTKAGCTTAAEAIGDGYDGWWKTQTMSMVEADMKAYAAYYHSVWRMEYCYGKDRSAWPKGACVAANCASCVTTPATGSATTCAFCQNGFTLNNGQCTSGDERCLMLYTSLHGCVYVFNHAWIMWNRMLQRQRD